ncbi:molybdate ABC transporter substrate-binding protein [Salipaludibacillus keqinensis]|uniref:Molybdate ABC transporter substrate-binding protein n=1 Tax=Salipaludibacillus keqinensis TaxID=2045207 RepID=A0A323TCT1_9BACI|nr:molybdate ABC transporter substrate-binding protein [Salipaludibacillus keqinensis]PYZ92014.1 molybdate ABC transporter substrate-binding protein [Salipaludibacillus keqinensis]
MNKLLFSGLVLVGIMTGCAESETESTDITVAAASDLVPAFNEIADLFEEERGVSVNFSFGSTGQLADQIENGAPFDVFAAANVSFIDRLVESGDILEDSKQTYAFGRIGLASMKDEDIHIDTIEELTSNQIRHISIANPDHAPYGLAAKQALQSAKVWEEVEGKLVLGRNITDALTQLETGNAEVGIIALSLFKAQQDELSFTLLEEELHEPLEQAIGVIERTEHEEEGREFIAFIQEGSGKEIMEKYGFVVPGEQ